MNTTTAATLRGQDAPAGSRGPRGLMAACACMVLWTAVYPFTRAMFKMEVNYNEGWNVYGAAMEAAHRQLYPAHEGWTGVNYPMLSFWIAAQLHGVTHDYLFTARVLSLLSLLGCAALTGLIVRELRGSRQAAVMAGMFCTGVFCADATQYVGMDDPQMLAQVFFLGGLLVYLRGRGRGGSSMMWAAALFVAGGCIKHNLIDIPLVVLADAAMTEWKRAAQYAAALAGFGAVALWANIHFGGPRFVGAMLNARTWSAGKSCLQTLVVFGPILPVFCAAVYMAWRLRGDAERRVLAMLLAAGLVIGGYFGGGQGASINMLFSALLATCMLLGIFLDECKGRMRMYAAPAAFAWLAVPMLVWGGWNTAGELRGTAAAQRRFGADVEFLQAQPGPALCESLLRCYFAGKPYIYDPFYATTSIQHGKLDAGVIVDAVQRRQYGAVQLDEPMEQTDTNERFAPAILQALKQDYEPAVEQTDTVIYVPKP